MANKKVLGRGLGAFFPDMEDQHTKKNPILTESDKQENLKQTADERNSRQFTDSEPFQK